MLINIISQHHKNCHKLIQNPGHLLLTKSSILYSCDEIGTDSANTTIAETHSDNDQQPIDVILTEV